MKNTTFKLLLMAGAMQLAFAAPAVAKDLGDGPWWSKERFQLRARLINVMPDGGGHTSIGGTPDADNAVVPEFDITYFMNQNWALELIAATSPHDLSAKNTTLGNLDLGDTMILPPTLTLQYHFTPDAQFSPYLGAGVNYTMTYSEDHGNDTTALDADNGFGVALQAGADYWLNDNWGLNLDVKKIWVDVDASINNGAITGNVELDPWVVGVGVSYRF